MQRGTALRRRRRLVQLAGGAVVLALVAIGVPQLVTAGDDSIEVVADGPGSTTTPNPAEDDSPSPGTRASTTSTTDPATDRVTDPGRIDASGDTTATEAAEGSGGASTTTAPSTTGTAPPSTTSTSTDTTGCRNSYEEACGPYYWDPQPGPNQPMTVEVTATPADPRPGEQVTFSVTVADPDARIERECNVFVSYGDEQGEPGCSSSASCITLYGPWTPPDALPDRYETTFSHVYEGGGDFTATFTFESRSACYDDPYGSNASGEAPVRVVS